MVPQKRTPLYLCLHMFSSYVTLSESDIDRVLDSNWSHKSSHLPENPNLHFFEASGMMVGIKPEASHNPHI